MNTLNRLCTTTAFVAALMATSPSWADVTAEQVWSDWQDMIESTGAKVTYDSAADDGILTINDLVVTVDEAPKTDIRLGAVVLQETGDGSVQVLLPASGPIIIETGSEKATLEQRNTGFSLIVSGTAGDLTYRYAATEISLALTEYRKDDIRREGLKAQVALNDLSGMLHGRTTGLRQLEQDFTLGKLAYMIDLTHPEKEISFTSEGSITNLQSDVNVAIPENIKTLTMAEAMDNGLIMKGNIGYNDIAARFTYSENEDKITGSGESGSGDIRMSLQKGDNTVVEASESISFGPIRLRVDGDVADNDMFNARFALDQLGGRLDMGLPENIESFSSGYGETSMADLMNAGFRVGVNLNYDNLDGAVSFVRGGEAGSISAISDMLDFGFSLSREMLRVSSASKGTEFNLETVDLPIGAIRLVVAQTLQDFRLPLKTTPDPQPFVYHEEIRDLAISDNLWAMFDPDAQIPRTAITYVLNVSGLGNWLVDPFAPEFDTPGNTKGELHRLTLHELLLRGAGVELTGAGDFTFNNDDLDSYDGIPAPKGDLELKLTGGNQILDTLVKIGVLSDEDALGFRMALGLFTLKGDGDDTIVSHIEANGKGDLLANGKRLK
ncbi:DUF2125 domain-containing protein [Profundibacter amoris]|uniref:DUF2125 domain-containing protein n=1 Tax=Profundibacter amoris TaxID=2171755 RepID=A0A347UJR7_9RHOB|nr:DUF2125 domain-containing protein [Profundibacter amoris]AXX99095.1 DUF2125 domain-containing protein [Profundibacter amoris]